MAFLFARLLRSVMKGDENWISEYRIQFSISQAPLLRAPLKIQSDTAFDGKDRIRICLKSCSAGPGSTCANISRDHTRAREMPHLEDQSQVYGYLTAPKRSTLCAQAGTSDVSANLSFSESSKDLVHSRLTSMINTDLRDSFPYSREDCDCRF